MHLFAVPAFADNYIWTLRDGRQAWVVDPGDAAPVEAMLESRDLRLEGILVTHHHADHVGGIATLVERHGAKVWGPAAEASRIAAPFEGLQEGDRIDVGPWRFRVMEVPGHTLGHIAYMQELRDGSGDAPVLFCGDTLFSGGCGRLFEGTPAQMHASLSRLALLPEATRVCCTHEYTLSNLRFARAVEPSSTALSAHEAHCRALRERGLPTLPSSIGLERSINPFLRTDAPQVRASALAQGASSDAGVEVFATLRAWKDHFR